MSQQPEDLSIFLQEVLQQLHKCCDNIESVRSQLDDLRVNQDLLSKKIEQIAGEGVNADKIWYTPGECWDKLNHPSVFAFYADIRKGTVFKAGKEIQ